MNKNFIIILLLLLSISLSGYIVYDKVLNKEDKTITNSNKIDDLQNNNLFEENTTNKQEENKTETNNDSTKDNQDDTNNENNLDNNQNIDEVNNIEFEKYEEIIETQLLKMLGSKSLSETPNQDRLAMVFEVYNNKYMWKEKISISELEEIKRDSAIKNIDVEYTNLADYNMSTNYNGSTFYQKNGGIYEYSNTGHSEKDTSIIYKELVNSNVNNNEIQLSYKFIFVKTHIKSASTTPGYHSLYYDLKGETFKELSFLSIHEEAGKDIAYQKVKSYIIENYETIKDNLYTYNFIFTNENNNIILKDYYRE